MTDCITKVISENYVEYRKSLSVQKMTIINEAHESPDKPSVTDMEFVTDIK